MLLSSNGLGYFAGGVSLVGPGMAAARKAAAAPSGYRPANLKPAAKTGTLAKLIEDATKLSPTT